MPKPIEYALIVALVAIIAIGVLIAFGETFHSVSQALASFFGS